MLPKINQDSNLALAKVVKNMVDVSKVVFPIFEGAITWFLDYIFIIAFIEWK